MTDWLKQNLSVGNVLALLLLLSSVMVGFTTVRATADNAYAKAEQTAKALEEQRERFRTHCEKAQEIQAQSQIRFTKVEGELKRSNEIQAEMDKKLDQILRRLPNAPNH